MTSCITFFKRVVWLGSLALLSCRQDPEEITCQPYAPPSSIDRYEFPVRPGTPAWATLQSGEEMINACQIPDPILKTISSEGLLETCLDYPLLSNMLAYTSLQDGVTAQMNNFNGFQALDQKPQAGSLLLDRYERMPPECYDGLLTLQERGQYAFSFSYLEMIFAQNNYLEKLSVEQKQQLMHEALEKHQQKKKHLDVYGIFGLKTTVFLMARLMLLNRHKPFLDAINTNDFLSVFVADVELQGRNETLDLVVSYAKEF